MTIQTVAPGQKIRSSTINAIINALAEIDPNELDQFAVDLAQISSYVAKTSDYTMQAGDGTVEFDCSSGAKTGTLPSAAGFRGELTIPKIDISANALNLLPVLGQTIGGQTSLALYGRISITLESNNANWIVTSGKQFVDRHRIEAQWFGITDRTGATTYTTELQTTFDVAYTLALPVGLPPFTVKTGKITYKGQSIEGHGRFCSILKGLPGEDILNQGSIGITSITNGHWSNFGFLVDDSVDASASFPNRGGVGNAGFASDYPDGSLVGGARPPQLNDYAFYGIRFRALSGTVRGQNKSCGIYTQFSTLLMSQFDEMTFSALEYGWWDDVPRTNVTGTTIARDDYKIGRLFFQYCGKSWRMTNVGLACVDKLIMHQPGTGLTLQGVQTTVSSFQTAGCHFANVFIEGATAALVFDGEVSLLTFNYLSTNGIQTLAPNWSAHQCHVHNWTVARSTVTFPYVIVSGNQNEINIGGVYAGSNTYLGDLVKDTGVGNRISISRATGANSYQMKKREIINADGRPFRHDRDTISGLLGYVDPMFKSSKDFLNTGSELVPSSSDFSYEDDSANGAYYPIALKVTQASGIWSCTGNSINGRQGYRVGEFLPPGKVRVYLRMRVGTAGNQNVEVRTVTGNALKGSGTFALLTTYAVYSFDIDLTGVAADSELTLRGNALSGGAAQPVWIDWVLFRPFAKDLLYNGAQTYTVTNPTTDRALNVTADTTAQVAQVLGSLIADLQAAGILK